MIQSNELRIGNCYLTGLEVIGSREAKLHMNKDRVIKLSLNHFSILACDNSLINFLYPIPITEEILLKCGFECYEFDNGEPNQYRFKSRLIVIRNGFFYDYGADVKIEFVHQLQNLCFALTGEELPINLTA